MSRLDNAVDARLSEIRDVARSGVTERTGKASRFQTEYGEERGRRIGGMISAYPEIERLGDSPAVVAKAIERGKGKIYRRVRLAVRREMEKHVSEPRKRKERPVIPSHERLTRKCKTCGVMHGKGQHRFHGKGSFHGTHMFSFNPVPAKSELELFKNYLMERGFLPSALRPDIAQELFKKYKRDRKLWTDFEKWKSPTLPQSSLFNPRTPRGLRKIYGNVTRIIFPAGHYDLLRKPRMYGLPGGEIWITWGAPSRFPRDPENEPVTRRYGRVKEIQAQKTQKHVCDSGCKEMQHKYFHPFTEPNEMVQLRDGSLLVVSR